MRHLIDVSDDSTDNKADLLASLNAFSAPSTSKDDLLAALNAGQSSDSESDSDSDSESESEGENSAKNELLAALSGFSAGYVTVHFSRLSF